MPALSTQPSASSRWVVVFLDSTGLRRNMADPTRRASGLQSRCRTDRSGDRRATLASSESDPKAGSSAPTRTWLRSQVCRIRSRTDRCRGCDQAKLSFAPPTEAGPARKVGETPDPPVPATWTDDRGRLQIRASFQLSDSDLHTATALVHKAFQADRAHQQERRYVYRTEDAAISAW